MKLTGTQVFSILIIVIMVGSIVSVFTYGNTQPGTGAPAPPPSGTPTTLSYAASGVQAKVLQIFPSGLLIAHTTAFETADVEAELRRIPGITLVSNSQFVGSAVSGEPNFRTELRFSSAEQIQEISAAISSLPMLSSAELFPQALVSVPEGITFTNPDLGLSQEYSFQNNQIPSYVTSSAAKGAEITIAIQADFTGQSLSSVIAFEEEEQPQVYFVDAPFTISEMQNDYFIRAAAPLAKAQALESARQDILDAAQDFNAQIEIGDAASTALIYFSRPETIFEQDLNAFLSGFGGVESFSISPDLNHTSVEFGGTGDYAEFRGALEEGLNAIGFTVSSITDPVISMQGRASPSIGKQAFLKAVSDAGKDNSLEVEALQKASIDADSLFVPDANYSFAVPAGSFTAYVNPSHEADDEVSLTMLVFASKSKGVVQIEAQEAEAE